MARKSESTIFDRAAKAAESGSSAECQKMLDELRELEERESPELAATRPPGQPAFAGARLVGQMPAGDRFRAASEANDTEAIDEIMREHARLSARLDRAAQLKAQLQKRLPIVRQEEALAAAPKKAKAALDELDSLLDRHEAVIAEFADIHAKVKATFDTLLEARKLDASVPSTDLQQFWRVGVALAFQAPKRREAVEDFGGSRPADVSQPLFGNLGVAVNFATILVDPPTKLRDRIRQVLGMRDPGGMGLDASWTPDTSDRAVSERLRDWHLELCRRLGAGDVDGARKLDAPRYRRGRPVFDEDAAA